MRVNVNASLGGAVAAAVAASACCIGPLILAVLGLGGAGLLVTLEPYRPVFTVLTLGLLGAAWFLTLRRPEPASGDACGCEVPRANKTAKRMLWVATGLVAIALAFPYVTPRVGVESSAVAANHTAILRIEGMTCASCAVTVEVAAGKLDGLATTEVDVAGGTATITFDGAKLSAAQVAEAITDAGYATTVVSDREV